jgi:hypothetical protein
LMIAGFYDHGLTLTTLKIFLEALHYAWRQRKKGCDWCVVKVVTSLQVDRTCDARLHWHQYSLTSEFLKVPNIYLIELSSST